MMLVRLPTSSANITANTHMPLVRRLPSWKRPSALFGLMMVVADVISSSRLVPSSPQRMSSATQINAMSSDDPPLLTRGRVRPVRGMSFVTPPTMMNACSTMTVVRPAATNELTSLFARAAVANPRMAKLRYSSSSAAAPRRPVSSPMHAKMKSLSTTGISVDRPSPIPVPNSPPSAREYRVCTSW